MLVFLFSEHVISLTWLVNWTVLVWDSIAENLALLESTWWENESIVQGLNEFRKASAAIPRSCPYQLNWHFIQNLFKPIVDRLGYEYLPSEPVDISQLRTRAIGQAAAAGDQTYVTVDLRCELTVG